MKAGTFCVSRRTFTRYKVEIFSEKSPTSRAFSFVFVGGVGVDITGYNIHFTRSGTKYAYFVPLTRLWITLLVEWDEVLYNIH